MRECTPALRGTPCMLSEILATLGKPASPSGSITGGGGQSKRVGSQNGYSGASTARYILNKVRWIKELIPPPTPACPLNPPSRFRADRFDRPSQKHPRNSRRPKSSREGADTRPEAISPTREPRWIH